MRHGDDLQRHGESFLCYGDDLQRYGESFPCHGDDLQRHGGSFLCHGDDLQLLGDILAPLEMSFPPCGIVPVRQRNFPVRYGDTVPGRGKNPVGRGEISEELGDGPPASQPGNKPAGGRVRPGKTVLGRVGRPVLRSTWR